MHGFLNQHPEAFKFPSDPALKPKNPEELRIKLRSQLEIESMKDECTHCRVEIFRILWSHRQVPKCHIFLLLLLVPVIDRVGMWIKTDEKVEFQCL